MEILHNAKQKVCIPIEGHQAMDILLYDVAQAINESMKSDVLMQSPAHVWVS